MEIRELQRRVDDWIASHGGYWDEMSMLGRLVEEVGELARELNHRHGAKRKKGSEPDRALADEMGDVLFILACLANRAGVELDRALLDAIDKYDRRDRDRWS